MSKETFQLALLGCALLAYAGQARGASSFEVDSLGEKYHVTADRTLYHSREKVYEAFGHVVVSSQGQRLASDYLWLDDNTKDIKARGNVVFVDKETTVQSAELHFNMVTGFGSIFYGRVSNDLYALNGQLIRRVGPDHYLTTEGEYTTCKDCPESWKLAAKNVDLTMDGYAFMDSVLVKIKDIPTLFVPYLVVPVKSRRQTGLLFPRIGATTSHGFVFVQPLFLAIDAHQDATIGVGRYSGRGSRYEGEYRYKSFNGIEGQANAYFTKDRRYQFSDQRTAIKTQNEWPFARNFGMRWRYLDMRDRDYSFDFAEDLNAAGYPALESNGVAQAPFDEFFASVEVKRYKNLLYDQPLGFDGGMVQALPTVHVGAKERQLAGPFMGNFYGRFDNFSRTNGAFFDKNNNGIFDPTFTVTGANPERIREARRTILEPEISAPFPIGPYFNLSPSVQYNLVRYDFSLPPPSTPLNSTSTSYLRYKVEASTTVERVYNYDGEKISKLKHQLTPFVNFSYIPSVNSDPNHVFQKQLGVSNGLFDQFDIVPLTNSTNFLRFPQGQSIFYGFTSRLVRRNKRPDEMPRSYPYDVLPVSHPRKYTTPYNRKQELAVERERLWDEFNPRYDLYQEIWTLNVEQAYDFIDARNNPDDRARAFSYLLAKSSVNVDDKFFHNLEYRYYPRIVVRDDNFPNRPAEVLKDKQWVTTSLTWYWKKLENIRHTRIFERSLSMDYTNKSRPDSSKTVGGTLVWSLNDFVNLTLLDSYDLVESHAKNWSATARLTHPSECWGLVLRYDWLRSRQPNPGEFGFGVLLNLTGTGFRGAKGEGGGGAGSIFGGT